MYIQLPIHIFFSTTLLLEMNYIKCEGLRFSKITLGISVTQFSHKLNLQELGGLNLIVSSKNLNLRGKKKNQLQKWYSKAKTTQF